MKAAVITAFGPASVLDITDVPQPTPKADEVLVRVRAAAINPKDTFIRKGHFKRFTGSRFPMLTGFDFAGEIAQVGAHVKNIKLGEAVFGMRNGWQGASCAEFMTIKPAWLALKPQSLSFEEAAAIPLVSLTALQALRDRAAIRTGQRICINGASGGVGSMAVQIAKLLGADVTAVSHERNHSFLKELGADQCIDYRKTNIAAHKPPFDIFFDIFGNQPFEKVKPALGPKGIWVSTVVRSHVFMSIAKTFLFSRKKAKLIFVNAKHADLVQVCAWVEAGKLKPIIQATFDLDRIQDAHLQQETKHTRGKIVIRI